MRYDKKKLLKQAKEVIKKNGLFFIEDIVAYLPCAKPTFYDYFKVGSDEMNDLKELLEENRVTRKVSMRNKWFESDNATLQMGLMKLIGTDEERKRLMQTHVEVKTDKGKKEKRSSVLLIM